MKILLFDFNNILIDVAKELENRGHTLLQHDGKKKTFNSADVIVVWNETELGLWRQWIIDARKAGKRVVLVQHGRRGTSRIFPPFNETLVSDVVCVWSKNDRQRMMSCGVPFSSIKITGTPIFKHLKSRIPHEGYNVVFSPEHWDVDVVENAIVMSKLRRLKGVNLICKLLEGEHEPHLYDNPVISNRKEEGHLDKCVEVLQTADLVVGISESTFELLAEAMDIPVIIADIWIPKACNGDDRYKEYKREYSHACTRTKDLERLNRLIDFQLKHPEVLRKERAEIAIWDGGIDIENPVDEIIKVILNDTPRPNTN